MSAIEQIIDYFLNLFRLQCKNPNPGSHAMEYVLLPGGSSPDHVYELRVRSGTEWLTRRMSVRQLGETVESKSTCFKVIYDDQLVVKIPPRPFTDFNKYLTYISNERHIVDQLSPAVQCLSPSLSAILNMIPELNFAASGTDPAQLEKKYTEILKTHSRLQKHLRIGEGFVFFMSLSRSLFFNQIIEKIHDPTRAQADMLKNTDMFEDIYAFEALYGDLYDDVFFKINRLYHEYGKIIDILLPQHENYDEVPAYRKQEWFYRKLAGQPIEIHEKELSPVFFEDLNELINILMEENEAAVIQFRGISERYIRKKIFDNQRKTIEGIITNIFNLLYNLKDRRVAIRDLKPDNIYIAGNFDDADNYLHRPEAFSMGLIDLETAVHLEPSDPVGMPQPLLAGTFSFMTPHHLFKNRDLYRLFGDQFPRVLYMQDWYAALGMIFQTVTGVPLFVKTARLMQKIFETKKKAVQNKSPMPETLKSVSWIFWHTASTECHQKIRNHQDKFKMLTLRLTEPVIAMLKEEMAVEKKVLTRSIAVRLRSKPALDRHREKLLRASANQVAAFRSAWEKSPEGAGEPPVLRKKIIDILTGMEALKQQMEAYEGFARQLEKQQMSCDELLVFFFNRILNAMYRQFWTYREYPGKLDV